MARSNIIRAHARQGEVLFFYPEKKYTRDVIRKCKNIPNNVIIEGELAGHKHEVINGKLYEHPTDKDLMILEAEEGCKVIHPEHGPVPFPKGQYEIKIQREFSPADKEQSRKVKD